MTEPILKIEFYFDDYNDDLIMEMVNPETEANHCPWFEGSMEELINPGYEVKKMLAFIAPMSKFTIHISVEIPSYLIDEPDTENGDEDADTLSNIKARWAAVTAPYPNITKVIFL